MTIPDEAVQAAARKDAEMSGRTFDALSASEKKRYLLRSQEQLTAALPFLQGVKVDVTDIGNQTTVLKDQLFKDADWLSEYGHQLHEECEYHDGGHTANRLQAIGERITKLIEKTELPEYKTVKRRIADALEYVWSGLDCDVDHIDSIISHMNGNGLRIVEVGIPATEPSPRAQALEEGELQELLQRLDHGLEHEGDALNGQIELFNIEAAEQLFADAAAAIRALSSQPVADGWLPIDDKGWPKYGRVLAVATGEIERISWNDPAAVVTVKAFDGPFVCHVHENGAGFTDEFGEVYRADGIVIDAEDLTASDNVLRLTHWRPLPSSPGASE